MSDAVASTTSRQWLRFRVDGDRILFRTWPDGEPEPSGWAYQGTDAEVDRPGTLFVSLVPSSANTSTRAVAFDELSLTEPD